MPFYSLRGFFAKALELVVRRGICCRNAYHFKGTPYKRGTPAYQKAISLS